MSNSEVIHLVSGLRIADRLMIVEEMLKHIREEHAASGTTEVLEEGWARPAILRLAGVMDEAEAQVMNSAVEEARKIDRDAA